jgi:hypothetical protein
VTNLCPATMSCPIPNGQPANACEDTTGATIGRCDSSLNVGKCQKCP